MSHYLLNCYCILLILLLIILPPSPVFFSLITCHSGQDNKESLPTMEKLPIITDLTFESTNICSSSYAIDNDRIICKFTTLEACCLPATLTLFSPAYSMNTTSAMSFTIPVNPLPFPSSSKRTTLYLLNPLQDGRHWICSFPIQNGYLPDQTSLQACQLLNCIFQNGYQYYGRNPCVTYYAPINFQYQITSLDSDAMASPMLSENHTSFDFEILEITSNHPVQLLPPYQYQTESGQVWEFSMIDAAGNGPCAITFLLEDTDVLLYNLTNSENKEAFYAGKSHSHCR